MGLSRSAPLTRSTPLRRTELSRGTATLERRAPMPRASKPMRQRSAKVARVYREMRVPLVERMLEAEPWCQLAVEGVCTGRSETVHELVKRSACGSITDPDNCRASCNRCNFWVGDHPAEARALGLSKRAEPKRYTELRER